MIRYDIAGAQAGGQRRLFDKAVRAGDYVHLSGQVPTVNGEVAVGGIVAQTEAVIADTKAVLVLAVWGLEGVIKVTCWLDDPRDFSCFNAVFERHFIDHSSARSTVQSRLMIDAKVEIDAIAWKQL